MHQRSRPEFRLLTDKLILGVINTHGYQTLNRRTCRDIGIQVAILGRAEIVFDK